MITLNEIRNSIYNDLKLINPFIYSDFNLSALLGVCALLIESAGIAAVNYNNQIEYLIKSIVDYVESTGYKDVYFELNDMLIQDGYNSINISDKIYIKIFFENTNTEALYAMDETVGTSNSIDSIVLLLIINTQVNIRTLIKLLFLLLYHELNHAIEDIERIKHNKQSLSLIITDSNAKVSYFNVINDLQNNGTTNCILYCIYRLFIDTELNALVSLIYSEIKLLKPDNPTVFKYKIKQTETYTVYIDLKKHYDNYIKDKNDWVLNTKQYFPKMKNSSDSKFKKWFINLVEGRLLHLWYKLWKAGYHYFNDHS